MQHKKQKLALRKKYISNSLNIKILTTSSIHNNPENETEDAGNLQTDRLQMQRATQVLHVSDHCYNS